MTLMLVLLVAAVVAVLARDQGGGYETYGPAYYDYYTPENIVHIEVCDEGNITVYPYAKNYHIEENYYGNFLVSLRLETEVDEIVFSLPYGWYYQFLDNYEDYDAYDARDYYPEGYYNYAYGYYDAYNYDGDYASYVLIELMPPLSYYDNYSSYSAADGYDPNNYEDYDYSPSDSIPEGGYVSDGPYLGDYDYYGDEQDDYIPGGGYAGEAPQYQDIMPLLGGHTVTFLPNGGTFLGGTPQLTTLPDGTVDSFQFSTLMSPNWPGGGRGFFWWSLSPDGRYDPAGGNHVDNFADRFDCSTVVTEDITLYAVWGINARFLGHGISLPEIDNDLTSDPTDPYQYGLRTIPVDWSINEATAFGIYPLKAGWDAAGAYGSALVMPNDPTRPGTLFWGWFNAAIPIENTSPYIPGQIDGDTILTGPTTFHTRWIAHTHLVMFEMNHANAVLVPGTAAQPSRLYRWALHGRSIADSGFGGGALTGLDPSPANLPVALDGLPWTAFGSVPHQWERQNRQRLWTPNAPPSNLGHIPREAPNFTTPYYPGSGLVSGAGAAGTQAGTMHPRSAPLVRRSLPSERWIPEVPLPLPGAGLASNVMRDRYTLEGWWTTPDGWRDNDASDIESRRFAPAAHIGPNTHVSPSFHTDHSSNIHARPEGFPRGLARTVHDSPYPASHPNHILNPPTGIVMEDTTVYAQWVYRVTFLLNGPGSHGVQGFSVEDNTNFNPGTSMVQSGVDSNQVNYRDILPCTPDALRNINDSGQRIRHNAGTFAGNTYVAHQVVQAGFPPYSSPSRGGFTFNGWWDRPIAPMIGDHYQNCTDGCITPLCYPAVHHGAQRIEGHTQINGSMTAYAHWRNLTGDDFILIRYNLNAPLASRLTEGQHGLSYWPTHAPYYPGDTYDNPDDRFFLSRWGGIPALPSPNANNGMDFHEVYIPGPRRLERNHRYTQLNLAYANVHYDDRYQQVIYRRYLPDTAIRTGHPSNSMGLSEFISYQRFPRNPRRAGYLFVGWSLHPDTQPLTPAGLPTIVGSTNITNPIAQNVIWPDSRPLTAIDGFVGMLNGGEPIDLYAVWAPAFELIFDGNDNTGPLFTAAAGVRVTNPQPVGEIRREFVRYMPFGFSLWDLRYAVQSRWGPPQAGGIWFGSSSMYNLDSSQISRAFDRANYYRLLGTAYTFNTSQDGRGSPIHGNVGTNVTRFTREFFYANGGVFDDDFYPPRPLYMRVYAQWGGRLTFHANHDGIAGHGPTRTAVIAAGQTVNQAVSTDTRNLNTPNVENIWGYAIAGNWQGTGGFLGNRGGWPRDPAVENPPRASDEYGGDWHFMFNNEPAGRTFLGWYRYVYPNDYPVVASRGMPRVCPSCRTVGPPPCPYGGNYRFYPDTPVYGHTSIFAAWSHNVIFNPGLGGDDVEMWRLVYSSTLNPGVGGPAGAPDAELRQPGNTVERPVPNAPFSPPVADPVWGDRFFMGWYNTPWFDPAGSWPPSLETNELVDRPRRFYAVFGIMVRFRPWGPGNFLADNGYMNHLVHNFPFPGCPGYYFRPHIAGSPLFIPHYRPDTDPNNIGQFLPYRRPVRPGWDNDQFAGEWFRFLRDPDCPVYDPTFDFIGPYCNDEDCCNPHDPANRVRYVPRCEATNRESYNTVWDNMTVYGLWRSRITFRPGHVRGLLTDGGVASNNAVTRNVDEGLTLNNNNPVGQRVPAVSYAHARESGWNNDPGLRFLGWRKVDFEGYPVIYEDRNVIRVGPNDPMPDLWTADEINNMRASLPHHFFEAVWQLQLDFYKVSDANPDHPLGYEPLPGARFVFERYMYTSGEGYGWVRVYPPISSDPEDPTFVTSDGFGRVAIGFTLAPGLELPQKANWPNCGTLGCYDNNLACCEHPVFRLVEILAPEGYMTPDGYWPVVISRYVGVRPDFSLSSSFPLPFENYLNFRHATITEEGPWEGIRQFVRNLPYRFDFWKQNTVGNRLPGAHIRIFEYTGPGTPNLEIITQAMIDSGTWVLWDHGVTTANDPLTFTLLPDRYYQFVEILAPPGHQIPMGQWRVTVNSDFPATDFPYLEIIPISHVTMPYFDTIYPFVRQTYVIENWRDFELPLAGGSGIGMITLAGTSLLVIATGIVIWMKLPKKTRE